MHVFGSDDILTVTVSDLGVPDGYDYIAPGYQAVVDSDGIEMQQLLEESADFLEFMDKEDAADADPLLE